MTAKNLWGDIENLPLSKAPIAILKEQSQILEKLTKGLLTGYISNNRTNNRNNDFLFDFFIRAPSLNNYQYNVLTIHYDAGLYPVEVTDMTVNIGELMKQEKYKNDEEFELNLQRILSSAKVKRVLSGLLAQIKAA